MPSPEQSAPPDATKEALRIAACLGALGYSPHEVHHIVATDLALDQCVVARMLRRHALEPGRAAA